MLVVCVFFLIAILWINQRWRNRHIYEMGRRLNSGLRTLPILGHTYLFIGTNETRMKIIQDLGRDALKHENGLTAFWEGSNLYTVVADPVAAAFITKYNLEKSSTLDVARLFTGNGSLFAAVNIWRPRRKVLIKCFAPTIIKQFLPLFTKNCNVLRQKLDKIAGTGTISISKYLTAFTMDVSIESTCGYDFHTQNDMKNKFIIALDLILRCVSDRCCSLWLRSDLVFCNLPTGKKSLEMLAHIWEIFLKFVTSKREEILERKDNENVHLSSEKVLSFLELLIQHSKDGRSYTDMEVIEELLIILAAGTDTSAVTSSYICLMLSRYPEVQQKVFAELEDVLGNSDRAPTLEDLGCLKYLENVIKETLRLYPPGPIVVRRIDKEQILPSGFKIVPGTDALINIWAIHRNPQYWGEDAEQFRPERFIDTPLKHPAAFMPFSFGPRNCVGYQYAMMSIKVAISTILRNFKILPPNDLPCSEQPPIRLAFDIMMKDVDKYQVRLERRV